MRVNLCSRKHKRCCFNWKRTSKDYTNFNTILTNFLYEIKYALIIYPSPCCEEFTTSTVSEHRFSVREMLKYCQRPSIGKHKSTLCYDINGLDYGHVVISDIQYKTLQQKLGEVLLRISSPLARREALAKGLRVLISTGI